ncbi:MAG: Dam family site-specific DNA-(adenine-N6)-methyltransferase [Candidatus Auribacterota bacterium]
MTKISPILRWAGGKSKILPKLMPFVPADYMERRYFEPFFGAGSLFFALTPQQAFLADLNEHLIECYKVVRQYPERVHELLLTYADQTSSEFYYAIRNEYNNSHYNGDKINQAARFIYLNKTCFNGIFRVNGNGRFNVPYGHKNPPAIPSLEDLIQASEALKNAELLHTSYEETLKIAKKGDFIYLDPPYPPINGTSFFTHYTKERFGRDDQIKVAEVAHELDRKDCKVMISNAGMDVIKDLFQAWHIEEIEVIRWITCKKVKHAVSEIIIMNYDIKLGR